MTHSKIFVPIIDTLKKRFCHMSRLNHNLFQFLGSPHQIGFSRFDHLEHGKVAGSTSINVTQNRFLPRQDWLFRFRLIRHPPKDVPHS